jgi:methylglutaconyl-CoA hydratase
MTFTDASAPSAIEGGASAGVLGVVQDGPIRRVRLSRPHRRNALSRALISSLEHEFRSIKEGQETRVVVLSGAGPVFCAGADLREFIDASSDEELRADADRLSRLFAAMTACPVPIIAMVQGAAYGGGFGLICAADVAIASIGTRFSLSEVRIGLVPAVISPYVVAALGAREAKARMLLGEAYGVEVALRQGLIHQCAPPEELVSVTDACAAMLLLGAPGALAGIKRLPNVLDSGDPRETRAVLAQLLVERRRSQEGQEGMTAFLEKRLPAWAPASMEDR